MITENSDPHDVAIPIGKSVCGKRSDISHANGTRTSATARILCRNESPDRPHAQKYPLKLKWIPAKMQSKI